MKRHLAQFAASVFLLSTLVCATTITVNAQGASSNAPAAQQQVTMREHELSVGENAKPPSKRDPNDVLAQVNEDMRQLTALSGHISTQATATEPKYPFLVETATEINKRSTRLRTVLALPQSEKDGKRDGFKDADKAELQPILATLNKLLDSFLHNPIFKTVGSIDSHQAAQARRDLDDIIVLSDKVRKNANKRSKVSGNAQ